MVFCAILWKAIKVRRAFNRLKQAKKNSYREAIGLPPIYPLYERPFRWIWSKLKTLFFNTCCICCKPRPGRGGSYCSRLFAKGTLPNEIAKSALGFVVGFIFSKLMLDFLTAQLNFHAVIVYWTCLIFGIILTLGMTFSDTVRCLFVLGLPQLFNSKGRVAMLAYLLVLALSGPGKNTAMNMEVLTESLVCGQNMVKESTQELVDLATAPWSALKKAVTIIIQSLDGVVGRMRKELGGVVDTIYDIINVIKKAYAFLKNIADMCNSKLGTPFDRCMSSFDVASKDCSKEMGSTFDWMCSPLDLFRHFCHFAKIPNLVFCWIPSLIKEHIFEPLKEHFKNFANSFSKFFDLKPLNVTYNFEHSLTQDKTLSEITSNMKAEIMGHVQWFLNYVDFMDLAISGFMLLVFWKAFSYRYKYLNSDEFDNYYISRELIRIDLRRKKLNRASIFPLRYRESTIYVPTFSWVLIPEERRHRQLAILFVSIAAVQICNYILMDYLLYSFLELIRLFGSIQLDTKDALGFVFTIEGEGFLAEMYRTILRGLSPIGGILPSFDTSKCLPIANPPNYWQYALILTLLVLTFIFAILEPYGLRLRHIICGWIYEKRIIQRETWLYQHILSTRDNFLEFAASQLKARLKGDKSIYQVSIMDRLAHMVPFCRGLFKTHTKKCFLCGQPGELEDFEYFIECPNCHTVYCKECFEDMGQKCLACQKKVNYEELSDFSEEFDSDGDSDEDRDLIEIYCSRLCRCSTCAKRSKSRKRSTMGNRSSSKEKYKDVKYQKLEKSKPRRKRSVSPPLKKRVHRSKSRSKSKSRSISKSRTKSPRQKSKPKLKQKSKSPRKIQKIKTKPSGRSKQMKKSKKRSKSRKRSKSKKRPKTKSKGGKGAMIASGLSGFLSSSGSRSKGSQGKKLVRVSSKSSKKRVKRSPRSKSKTREKSKKSRSKSPSKRNRGPSRKPRSKRSKSPKRKQKSKSPRSSKKSSSRRRKRKQSRSKSTKSHAKKRSSKTTKTRTKSLSPVRKSTRGATPPRKKRAHSESKSMKRQQRRGHSSNSTSARKKVTKTRDGRKQSRGSSHHKSSKNHARSKTSRRHSDSAHYQEQQQHSLSSSNRKSRSKSVRSKSPTRRNHEKRVESHEDLHEMHDYHHHKDQNSPQEEDDEDDDDNEEEDQGSSDDSEESCQECQLEREWWNRDPKTWESFRRPPNRIAVSLQQRVNYLNDFYEQMPYPPMCNL